MLRLGISTWATLALLTGCSAQPTTCPADAPVPSNAGSPWNAGSAPRHPLVLRCAYLDGCGEVSCTSNPQGGWACCRTDNDGQCVDAGPLACPIDGG